ncbi:hypothetical protein QTG54_000358 [Skeletonema marinoi]|uniref:Uncharacterized protein n=1 Tax=Skeletonema marinoi TaxID=267567 RepID=A0AAD8YKT0_9STRA|nr:hypothetical protein QTG54_000358 [Skeletonema marinoi]
MRGMQQQANKVIDALFQQSRSLSKEEKLIPWLDCARSYGLSEKFVGEFLRSNMCLRQMFTSQASGDTRDVGHIGEYVKLYQVHSATFDSGILTNTKVHEALSKCREEKGWKIGLSVSGPSQDDLFERQCKSKYLVNNQRPHDALIEAHESVMDIIIKEGLANGRTLSNPTLKELSSALNCQPDQLALAAILAQPFQPRVLSGSVTVDQLRSNLGSFYSIEDPESMSVAERLVSTAGERKCCKS